MAIEVGTSTQSRGISVRRATIPAAPSILSVSIPPRVAKFAIQNVGTRAIRFNFDDDSNTDYWTLGVGVTLPFIIEITESTSINLTAIGGTSIAEVVFWG